MPFQPLNLGEVYQTAEAVKGARKRNALADLDIKQAESFNALGKNASAEDYARIGRADVGNALTNAQRFSQEQQINNTKLLNAAAAEVAQNPAAAARWLPQLQQAGVLSPGFDPSTVPPEQLQQAAAKLFQSTSAALAALNGSQQGDMPSNVREWEYYKTLSPDDQTAYREMKRQQNPFTPAEFGGARGSFNKNTGGFTPLASLEDQVEAEGQIAGAKAGEAERAKTTVEAQFDLGRVEENVSEAINVIDQLSSHKGLPYILGFYSKAPIVPNTPQAAADALAQQIQGQTFLQAFQTLKGGGAITETEGAKATAAIGRLSRAQSVKEYKAALAELKGIAIRGRERARKRAGNSPQSPGGVAPQPADPTQQITATGPNGQKLILQNGQWVPFRG